MWKTGRLEVPQGRLNHVGGKGWQDFTSQQATGRIFGREVVKSFAGNGIPCVFPCGHGCHFREIL